MIHLDSYSVQGLDPIFGDHALRNIGICLSQDCVLLWSSYIVCFEVVSVVILCHLHSSAVWRCAVEWRPAAACHLYRSCSVGLLCCIAMVVMLCACCNINIQSCLSQAQTNCCTHFWYGRRSKGKLCSTQLSVSPYRRHDTGLLLSPNN
jgi:hypothetical protein